MEKSGVMRGPKIKVFVLALLMCVLAAGTALAQTFGVIYNTDSLNLRGDGSSSSALLGTYYKGTWVEITGSKNNFYYVTTPDGRRGYMSKNYITKGAEATALIGIVNNANGGAFLNFRSSPNYDSQVLGIFYNGVPLYVMSRNNGWSYVQINGVNGYVRNEYLTFVDRVGSSAVATIKTPGNTAMNLRQGPGTGYGVIRQFSGDRYVMVLAKGNGWWRVSIDGYTGFMSSDFLKEGLHAAKDQNGGGGGGGTAYAVVNNPKSTQALNLRMAPTTSSQVLEKLRNGDRLYVEAQGTQWCQVHAESTGVSGFVMTQYLKLHNLPATPTMRVSHTQAVNLRSDPNLSAQILAQVPNGKNVTIVAPGEEWCKVKYNGYTGYMLKFFLK